VPVFLHDGQYVAGEFASFDDASRGEIIQAGIGLLLGGLGFAAYDDQNVHTALALAFTGLALGGIVDPADISAYSSVYCIENASVDSAATAVANNISVSVLSDVDGGTDCITGCDDRLSNHVVIADITQWAYANVKADSDVYNVEVNNYTNLGLLDKPLVSSVATAVGNNVSITVGPLAD